MIFQTCQLSCLAWRRKITQKDSHSHRFSTFFSLRSLRTYIIMAEVRGEKDVSSFKKSAFKNFVADKSLFSKMIFFLNAKQEI